MRRVLLSDHPEILSWFSKRGLEQPPIWSLSDEGFIEPGVAAGFLYLTNSGIAQIDFYISNPEVNKEDRILALQGITKRILLSAKVEHDIRLILCSTKIKSIEEMARFFNFRSDGMSSAFSKIL